MSTGGHSDITDLLQSWRGGDAEALEALVPMVYGELRHLAAHYLGGEGRSLTLQPTALVHEAYLRLAGKDRPRWRDRRHFFTVAALLMRRILIDHARKRRAQRRGGGEQTILLEDSTIASTGGRSTELLALDQALERLGQFDPDRARVVELRFFAGLTLNQTAEVLDVSQSTVVREWRLARAWLHRELYETGPTGTR